MKKNSISKSESWDIASSLLTGNNTRQTYKTIVDEACKIINAIGGTVYLGPNGKLNKAYTNIPKEDRISPRKNGFTKSTYSKGELRIVPFNKVKKAHPNFSPEIKSIVQAPLSYNNQKVGVISLYSKEKDKFTQNELDSLKKFAALASLAIEKSIHLKETQEKLKSTDLFLKYARHELKTPLTSIRILAQLLVKKLQQGHEVDPAWAKRIAQESQRLENLINELLKDTIQEATLQYRIKKCKIIDILDKAFTNLWLSSPLHVTDINVKIPDDTYIKADAEKLIQAFTNIFSNAAKFSKKGTKISIDVTERINEIIVTTIDEGSGITKKDLSQVFKPFFRGEGSNSVEGRGIGLHLVKEIIDKHEGSIQITSRVGKGTTVVVSLPKNDR